MCGKDLRSQLRMFCLRQNRQLAELKSRKQRH
jgi:hypothetical protein